MSGRFDDPRRVLHLIDTAGPGGAETVFANLVAGLPGSRWSSTAVLPWGDDWLESALHSRGVAFEVVESRSSFDLWYLAKLVRLARTIRPHLIQTHLLTTAVYGSVLARVIGCPVVSTFHGTADAPVGARFRGSKFRMMRRPESRFVFVSDALRSWFLETTRLPRARCRVVHNGISFHGPPAGDTRAEARAALGAPTGSLLVGALGNVRPSKDYHGLLHAAAAVTDSDGGDVRFLIAGEGANELHRELEALREELDLGERVRFLGFVSDSGSFLDALDLYVLTSSSEGFSLSTAEAMSRGLPVVATRCGGPEEIVEHGRTGLLVDVADHGGMARALMRLANDADLRARLGRAAARSVRDRFSIERMVEGYEAIYDELMRESSTRGRSA